MDYFKYKEAILGLLASIIVIGYTAHISLVSNNSHVLDLSPFGRDEWRSKMRGGTATTHNVSKAKSALLKKYQAQPHYKDAGLNTWTELNNHEEGGRVRALAVHPADPDILFSGGASGGLWKSTNQGTTWSPIGDMLPSLSISTILIHPIHPDTMFVSTGEVITAGDKTTGSTPGAGIFRSQNGGITWQLVPALRGDQFDDFYWVQSIAFNPNDPSIIYAGKNGTKNQSNNGDGELWRFENFGETKTQMSLIPDLTDIIHIVVNPNDSANIAVCTEDNLVITQDGGQSWVDVDMLIPGTLGRAEVAFDPSDEDKIYALFSGMGVSAGVIYSSDDKGLSWTLEIGALTIFDNSFGNQGWYNNVIWVDPLNTDNIIVGGIDLWRYEVGSPGLTKLSDWTVNDQGLSAHADQHIIVAATDYSANNRKIYVGNDGGIASTNDITTVTTNSGWNLLNNGLNITQYYWSDIDGSDPHLIIAGSQDNGTIYTDDSGASWEKVNSGDGGYCAISAQDPTTQYSSTQNGDFEIKFGTLTGFIPYFDLAAEQGDAAPFITPMAIYPNDGNQIVVGGQKVYHIELDPTLSTSTVIDKTPNPPPNSFYDVSAIAVSEDGFALYVGYSDGSLWRYLGDITIAPAIKVYQHTSDRPITSIAIHPNLEGRVAISIGGYVEDNIIVGQNIDDLFLSNHTWTVKDEGIAGIHVNHLTWHPSKNNWIYAGTDFGIMASEDNGNNWNVSPNFLNISDGPVFTEVTKLQFTEAQTLGGHFLVATTYGRGIWKSDQIIRDELWLDHSTTNMIQNGLEGTPFQNIDDATIRGAHGQNWYIEAGTYTSGGNIIIDKRLGEINKTGNGSIIIGNN